MASRAWLIPLESDLFIFEQQLHYMDDKSYSIPILIEYLTFASIHSFSFIDIYEDYERFESESLSMLAEDMHTALESTMNGQDTPALIGNAPYMSDDDRVHFELTMVEMFRHLSMRIYHYLYLPILFANAHLDRADIEQDLCDSFLATNLVDQSLAILFNECTIFLNYDRMNNVPFVRT